MITGFFGEVGGIQLLGFDRISINRIKKRWQAIIDEGRLVSVKMTESGSIIVVKTAEANVGSRPISNTFADPYTPDEPAYKALFEIIEPMKAGETRFFNFSRADETTEELYSLELIEYMFSKNQFYSVELKNDGTVGLFYEDERDGAMHELLFAGKEHIDFILDRIRPIEAGEKIFFNIEESKQ